MADTAEAELIELVSREQREMRRILMAGIGALLLVVIMSAGLGIYYFTVVQELSGKSDELGEQSVRLEGQAFNTRRLVELQSDRLQVQDRKLATAYEEMKALVDDTTGFDPVVAREASQAYLTTGRQSLKHDRIIERAGKLEPGTPAGDYYAGVDALIDWAQLQDQIGNEAGALRASQERARSSFEAVRDDPEWGEWARLGVVAVEFRLAQASGYKRELCEPLIADIEALGADGPTPLQALYWTATCERKLGRPAEAMGHFVEALDRSREIPVAADDMGEAARAGKSFRMNAFHGLGTVLIAVRNDDSDEVEALRARAVELCEPPNSEAGLSARSLLALACLQRAIGLREELLQTRRQIVGTSENLSFVYLADDNYQKAFDHAQKIEKEVGLTAWNELMRAVSAMHLENSAVEQEARRHVALLDQKDFNLCEMRVLLDEDLFDEAKKIVQDRPGPDPLDCNEGI